MGSIMPTWARKPLANQTQPVGQPTPMGDPGAFQPSPGGIPAPSGMPTFDQLPPGVPQQGAYQQPQAPSGMPTMQAPPTWGTVGTKLGQSTVQTQPQGGGMSLYGLGVPGMQQGGWLQPSQGQTLANPWNPFQGRLSGMIRG